MNCKIRLILSFVLEHALPILAFRRLVSRMMASPIQTSRKLAMTNITIDLHRDVGRELVAQKQRFRTPISFSQTGVGMIEVLVTLFILTVGLLGVASLQFIGTFSNADALNRSQAVMVAQQISERLRANAALSGTSNGMVVDNNYFDDSVYNFENLTCGSASSNFNCHCLTLPAGIPDCRNNTCTPAQLATFDAYEMSCAVASANPNIRVNINCADNNVLDADSCSGGSRHSIVLKWPVENWHSVERVLNPKCNASESNPHDCVVLDITL